MIQQQTKVPVEGCGAVKGNKAHKLTRKQKLRKALKHCRKKFKHAKKKRKRCEKHARKKFAAKKHHKKKAKKGKKRA